MQISIQRAEGYTEYHIPLTNITLLEALRYIKTKIDNTLAFSSGCRSSVCGSCSMRVNGREVLACAYKVADKDKIQALNNVPIIRDLVVDMDKSYKFNSQAKAWLQTNKELNTQLNSDDEKINELQSDCILCGSCYSVCPVYSVNSDFLGPFALTRVWKYVSDPRESKSYDKIKNIQENGIWDCTLCNECTIVCPQSISSKADIEKLRMKSAQFGFMDPNFASFDSGFGSFDGTPTF